MNGQSVHRRKEGRNIDASNRDTHPDLLILILLDANSTNEQAMTMRRGSFALKIIALVSSLSIFVSYLWIYHLTSPGESDKPVAAPASMAETMRRHSASEQPLPKEIVNGFRSDWTSSIRRSVGLYEDVIDIGFLPPKPDFFTATRTVMATTKSGPAPVMQRVILLMDSERFPWSPYVGKELKWPFEDRPAVKLQKVETSSGPETRPVQKAPPQNPSLH